jgi:hypothetical protein
MTRIYKITILIQIFHCIVYFQVEDHGLVTKMARSSMVQRRVDMKLVMRRWNSLDIIIILCKVSEIARDRETTGSAKFKGG